MTIKTATKLAIVGVLIGFAMALAAPFASYIVRSIFVSGPNWGMQFEFLMETYHSIEQAFFQGGVLLFLFALYRNQGKQAA